MARVLRRNPFTPNAPIDDPARFSGRDVELEAIIDALYQTANSNPVHLAITGARGIGKTSILHMAAQVASGDRILIDRIGLNTGAFKFRMLPVIHTGNRGETVEAVANALLAQLRDKLNLAKFKTSEIHWEVDLHLFKLGGSAGPALVPHVIDALVATLERASRLVGGKYNGILLMVDEIDRLTRISEVTGAVHEAGFGSFFKVLSEKLALRGLKNVGICLCGVEGFLQELREEHPSIERVFRDVPIPPLSGPQAEQIVIAALDSVGYESTPEARKKIVKLSGYYPEPVHLIGSEAFKADSDQVVDEQDVDMALGRVVRYIKRNHLKNILADAGAGRDREILGAMAAIRDTVVPVRTIGERIGLAPYQFGSNMTRLVRKDVLVRVEKGQYRFREPLLGTYIDQVGLGAGEEEEEEEE